MATLWTYSDWITQTDNATRLTRLRLHIQEVSEQLVSVESDVTGVKTGAVDVAYLQGLQKEEQRLTVIVERSTTRRWGGRNRVSLRKWL